MLSADFPFIRDGLDLPFPKGALLNRGELTAEQGACAFNAMKSALIKGSDGSGQLVTGVLLNFQADGPVQSLIQVLTSLIASEPEESLPSEFFQKLHLQDGPGVFEGDVTIRDGSIACPDPLARITKAKGIVQEVCLQSLEWAGYHLPSVLGLFEGPRAVSQLVQKRCCLLSSKLWRIFQIVCTCWRTMESPG